MNALQIQQRRNIKFWPAAEGDALAKENISERTSRALSRPLWGAFFTAEDYRGTGP